jgi:hypothetical protein
LGGGDAAIDAARKEIRVHLGRFQHWSYSDAANLALFAAQCLQSDPKAEMDMLTLATAPLTWPPMPSATAITAAPVVMSIASSSTGSLPVQIP